jgi:hypothetical protein
MEDTERISHRDTETQRISVSWWLLRILLPTTIGLLACYFLGVVTVAVLE